MIKNKITLSINPWYFCNFGCNFCYLTEQQLDDKTLLDLTVLASKLDEAMTLFEVERVDLYGGEIGLLPKAYVKGLKDVLFSRGITDINIITNLSMVNDVILDPDFSISVSYDFSCREKHEDVFNNMLMFPRPFSVLMLASPCLIEQDVDEMIYSFNLLKNLQSVEIKPYSANQSNTLDISYTQFEDFVKSWLTSTTEKNFTFINEHLIQMSLFKQKNSFSDDHIYLTPAGKFAVLEFDLNDNEYFSELGSIQEYVDWTHIERARVQKNSFCSSCEYYGSCLSEHLKTVKSLEFGCNGFKHLIDWYKETYAGPGKEWKVKQELYHNLVTEYTDDLRQFTVEFEDDIVAGAIKYFSTDDVGWIYPAKSYVVGVCYARWLSELYGLDFYTLLDDKDLLYGNDPYFVPYSQNKPIYDEIISRVTLNFDETVGVIPDVKRYFLDEMFIK